MTPAATTNGTANGANGHAAKLDFKVGRFQLGVYRSK